MPWHIVKGGGTCSASEWAVIKDSDGSTEGCHPTEDAAKAQQAALYAGEPSASTADDHEARAAVDLSEWDANAAMTSAKTAADYRAICACRKAGPADQRSSWGLPHHKRPGAAPNANGVRAALARLSQTEGCTNNPRAHLEAHMTTIQAQAAMQADAAGPEPLRQLREGTVPAGAARSLAFPSRLEVREVDRDGEPRYHLHGVATVYEQPYEMYDLAGPYKESVAAGAGAPSLAKAPDVAFLVNHKGMTMARTTNGTLDLREEDDGLHYDAYLNPKRQDVRDLKAAVEDRSVTESSFAFMITAGSWNADYTEYRIEGYDIDRGDVSAVNFGANPWTSVAARSREVLADLDHLPAGAARAALIRLQQRPDLAPPEPPGSHTELVKQGRSVALWQHLLSDED